MSSLAVIDHNAVILLSRKKNDPVPGKARQLIQRNDTLDPNNGERFKPSMSISDCDRPSEQRVADKNPNYQAHTDQQDRKPQLLIHTPVDQNHIEHEDE